MIKLKRIYQSKESSDGYRILVDRLWPRGVSKQEAHIDLWLKDIAPSDELRKWFNHDPKKWVEFKKRYKQELETQSALVQEIIDQTKKGDVTLLYAAKDESENNAVALKEFLE